MNTEHLDVFPNIGKHSRTTVAKKDLQFPFCAQKSIIAEMKEHMAQFRFYEELNDFLPPEQRKMSVDYRFNGCPAIKDPIEAMGIPHTEVELIIVNGESVGFDCRLRSGDRVAVYPVFESLDISPLVRLRPAPLRCTSFVLDVHLGRLARILRLLGFDVLYRNDFDDEEIIRISLDEHRIILTRDRPMLFNKVITHAHWLHSTDAEEQAVEVLRRFDLFGRVRMFHRCPVCNGSVQPVDKECILDRLEPLTKKYYDLFFECSDCGKIYWQGPHYDRILQLLERISRSGRG